LHISLTSKADLQTGLARVLVTDTQGSKKHGATQKELFPAKGLKTGGTDSDLEETASRVILGSIRTVGGEGKTEGLRVKRFWVRGSKLGRAVRGVSKGRQP